MTSTPAAQGPGRGHRLPRRLPLPRAVPADAADGTHAATMSCSGARRTTCPSVFEFGQLHRRLAGGTRRRVPRAASSSPAVATLVVLVVSLPAAYYTARNPLPRADGLPAARARHPDVRADRARHRHLYREFVSFGLVNTYLTLIVVNAAFNLAFSIWIMSGYISTIPVELEEAAAIDGCTRLGVLWRVTLPLALPGHRHGGHLHLHRGLERVRHRADPDQLARHPAPDGRRHDVHRAVRDPVALPVRGVAHRDRAGGHPVRVHRALAGRRTDGRQRQVTRRSS